MAWLNSWGNGKYDALDDLALAPELHKEIFGEGFVDFETKQREINYEIRKK